MLSVFETNALVVYDVNDTGHDHFEIFSNFFAAAP